MHPNPVFRKNSDAANIEFAASRGFGTLAINADPAPLLAHVPFIIDRDASTLNLHLVRSNPIVKLLKTPQPAVLSVTGPDSYISPDWYGTPDRVPTWNYVAVHLRGTLSLVAQHELADHLDELTARFEACLAPKPPWLATKLDPSKRKKMMRMIVPARLQITDIHGTWKLGQNKPVSARLSAAKGVVAGGIGHETQALATLMRDPPGY